MELTQTLTKSYPVRLLTGIFGFCRSSYYDEKRKLLNPEKKDSEVRKKITQVALGRPAYGYRRVTHQLKREGIVAVSYTHLDAADE